MTMRTRLSLLVLCCTLILMSGCSRIIKGNGHVETRDVPAEEYNQLSVACPAGNIHYSQSDADAALSVTTDKNVHDMLDIYVRNQTLVIKLKEEYKEKFIWPSEFTVRASSREMKKIQLAGNAEIDLDGPFTAENLDIRVAGSGTISLNDSIHVEKLTTSLAGSSSIQGEALNVGTLESDVAGSGTYRFGGTAENVSFGVAGKGTVRAYDLKARNVSCKVAGYGSFKVYASENLSIEAAGFARLSYKGNPSLTKKGLVLARKTD